MKKLMFIVNPNAGKGGYRASLGEVLHTLYGGGYLPEVHFTAGHGDAKRLAAACPADCKLLVCMGGDGTLSEVAEGLAQLDSPPELGYIPMGTANDVATCLDLSRSPVEAAETIITGRSLPYDLGSFNGEHCFTYVAAFGAFTDVSYRTPQQNKQALGHFAYVLEGMTRLPNLPTTAAIVEHDGGVIEGDFIFGGVSNTTSLGGMLRLDDDLVDLGDGRLELLLVRAPHSIADLQTVLSEFVAKDYDGTQIKILHTTRARFRFPEPIAWTRDGEDGGAHREVKIKALHRAVSIRVK